jgi:hypothetical protein
MADLLLTLRGLTAAGSAEYTVNAVSYWTDQQLQDVMDRHVYPIRHEELLPLETYGTGGTVTYLDYQSPRRFLETTSGGTSRFVIQDEGGTTVGTASYSVDYPKGLVTFTADTTGLSRFLTGFSYDVNAAAADVWGQKAAHYVTAYDFSTDNHNLRRSQIIQNCLTMSKEYASGAAVYSVTMERSDTSGISRHYDSN